MQGSAENSFLRAGMKQFFDIKENKALEKALQDMAKLLMNSTYGKLIEVQMQDFLVAEHLLMPRFANVAEVARSIVSLFASAGAMLDEIYWGETQEQQAKAKDLYKRRVALYKGPPEVSAVTRDVLGAYLDALRVADVERSSEEGCSVGEYVQAYKTYKCGHFFMPLYAAQVTGATSAMVGLMAHCVDAYQGDTDSVHVPLPPGVSHIRDLPGFDRYFQIMTAAGYPSTRIVDKDGKLRSGGIDEIPKLGAWEEEVKEPTVESIYVRSKVYSHKMADGTYKQAKHGFAKFNTPEISAAAKAPGIPREIRIKNVGCLYQANLHEAMKTLLLTGNYEYDTRPSPRRLREAIVHGIPKKNTGVGSTLVSE
jgi:hypothetical protein